MRRDSTSRVVVTTALVGTVIILALIASLPHINASFARYRIIVRVPKGFEGPIAVRLDRSAAAPTIEVDSGGVTNVILQVSKDGRTSVPDFAPLSHWSDLRLIRGDKVVESQEQPPDAVCLRMIGSIGKTLYFVVGQQSDATFMGINIDELERRELSAKSGKQSSRA